MPGPKDAKISKINHYLCPLVAELKTLYDSVMIPTAQCPQETHVCTALFLAAHKTCGFTSHTSVNTCHIYNLECTIINLMYNPFVGTTKCIMEKWISTGLISNAHLIAMQDNANKLHVPIGYTSLRKKIIKTFPFIKADKWKSWCLVYSPTVLSDHLLQKHFDNWMCFVNACQYLAMPSLTYSNLAETHFCLELFGRNSQTLYGEQFITPNMYLHLHIKETVLNFGPAYGYWLFCFEHFNSIVKSYKTNKKTALRAHS
ncbi:hypothetical protein PHYBLDRAFT_59502 [Phycomyces blakesleeanus NRRL 1555(-)]|uniref:Uncharacterized protein n=1 Tax=Phycomyces blakesleeanus (strain ATCC 8743b / DSM 1359 / FGSC 10004 / NBRC 33097 / NRRL 1555) TaxID=763407 RepID=A0A163AUV4_PHYB8|nr:hypothetical protein PHYBLDRAFT_59502 [Phycomyces blakesleeanus NRRL 1555(-)]OAD75971.1 hypothetical protein PHYBLDRAFT_59502 [Phycomyces blakesleeanus NRRL 1555(-)]|eukprot:XP_018294011.1 hypothetical protein PHYBLDRAFT_59502 [Phycomyces blakesleeanus NRRL 1555(-)]